ncbi:HNH endonuclease [Cryobacterium cryoconiti]|nr:HNH endonuclease [Cryobacterium cryoconiti]
MPDSMNAHAKFCSVRCRVASHRSARNPIRSGTPWTIVSIPSKQPPPTFPDGYCSQCGKELLGRKRKYCDRSCANRAYNAQRRFDGRARDLKYRRRALLRDARVEAFEAIEIFERDGYLCRICDEPLNMLVDFPHPLYPTIDHIFPLALGGEHSRANAQSAHLTCNVRKGTRLIY